MAGFLYWIWRRWLWRQSNGVTAGSKRSKEWAEKMYRIRLRNQERRNEIEDLKHQAEKARLELELAKADAEIADYEGEMRDDDREPRSEPNPMANFASVALQALMSGGKRGETNVRAIDRGSSREFDGHKAQNDGDGGSSDNNRASSDTTAQELLDEIEDEPDA